MKFEKRVLEGTQVRLEPLSVKHREGLCNAILDGELWRLFVTMVPHPDNIDTFLADAEDLYQAGDGVSFAIIDKASGRVAGSTRFMKANIPHRRVEIGYSFLAKSWQKTRTNTETKFLMLNYAFETLGFNRVELLTDYLNQTSRKAIARLGARQEGILRSHMVMPDGRLRDSVLYSMIKHEWPGIKQHLTCKLA